MTLEGNPDPPMKKGRGYHRATKRAWGLGLRVGEFKGSGVKGLRYPPVSWASVVSETSRTSVPIYELFRV